MHAFINTLCYTRAFTCTYKLNKHHIGNNHVFKLLCKLARVRGTVRGVGWLVRMIPRAWWGGAPKRIFYRWEHGTWFLSWFLHQPQRNTISTEGNPPPGPMSICCSGGSETLAVPLGIPIIWNLMNSRKSVYMWFIESHSTHYIHTMYKGCWLQGLRIQPGLGHVPIPCDLVTLCFSCLPFHCCGFNIIKQWQCFNSFLQLKQCCPDDPDIIVISPKGTATERVKE